MERIALARKYRVEQWLRDAYLELTEKAALDFEELRPAEPFSNGEFNPLDRNWEETSRDWETLARIFYLRAKVATSVISTVTSQYSCRCFQCGGTYSDTCLCATGDHLPRSKLPVSYAMVDEIFRGELKSFKENPGDVEIPLPRKLPTSYLCPLKTILYSQQHRQRKGEGKEIMLIEIVNFSCFVHFIAQPVLASM